MQDENDRLLSLIFKSVEYFNQCNPLKISLIGEAFLACCYLRNSAYHVLKVLQKNYLCVIFNFFFVFAISQELQFHMVDIHQVLTTCRQHSVYFHHHIFQL